MTKIRQDLTWSEVCAALEAAEAERDALRATLREIAGMARDAREARAATARIALGMLANLAEAAAKGGD